MDHLDLYFFGGSDRWWNLDPKLRVVHREKSRRDTSIAAKAVRIDDKWRSFLRATAKGRKPPRRKSTWPKRKMQSRSSF